ncbi:putative N-acetyltransferase YjcF [Labeo rohita]|uniref:N-acetyltransferase YjcF n=1 Tax=Labeo rohita TaxID=84645 RepID=A0ABQ8LCM8_LABRO|nr:putative N-acetyltransferase YjcF [Labeo rohita]
MEGCVVHLHSVHFRGVLSAQPIIVNFHQLFQTRDAPAILPTIKNEDVLRAVVALLDTSLPDIGPRDMHETVHYPGIYTVILSRDHADVLEDYRGRASQKRTSFTPVPCKTTVKANCTSNMLAELWSWEQFCEGLQEFVDEAKDRKERRAVQREDGKIPPSAVGVESLIVAAACYELKILSTGDMVLQLSLLAVRKRYRHLGIGSYIMELLKTQSVVGKYDTLVAHADTDAIGFFKGHGLTDDLLLNDQFKKSQALFAYQQQVTCVTRLLEEVKILHKQLDLQREEVDRLNSKLELEKQKRHDIEKRFLMYRLKNTQELLDSISSDSDDQEQTEQEHSKPGTQDQEKAQSAEPSIQTPEGAGV